MSRELLQKALDALKETGALLEVEIPASAYEAIVAIDMRLAQPEQDPVGMIVPDSIYYSVGYDQRNGRVLWTKSLNDYPSGSNLYTHPQPERKPLTDEEIEQEHDRSGRDQSNVGLNEFMSGVRFAEKAHGIE